MSDIAKVTDHWTETVSDFILEQYKDASNWKAILKAVIDKYSDLEDQIWKLAPILDFKCRVKGEIPTGALLDFIAGIMNVTRNGGESDMDFYERFVTSLDDDSAGTPDNVIYNAAILSGDPKPQYIDEVDCTFFVYTGRRPKMVGSQEIVTEDGETVITEDGETVVEEVSAGELYGGGDQLYARQVKNLAPAGCLGLVGAAIQFADGNLMGDAKGRLVLMVADDSTAARNLVLVNDNLRPVLTSQNEPVRAVVKGVTVPKVEVNMGGQYYDGVRIKDLPDAQDDNGFFVRDSEAGGTVKADKIDTATIDELWDSTEPENENG